MDGNDLSDPVYLQQWHFLDVLVLLRNNCETWFAEMKTAGISDIVLPNRKKRQENQAYIPTPAEPTTFHVSEIIDGGRNYGSNKSSNGNSDGSLDWRVRPSVQEDGWGGPDHAGDFEYGEDPEGQAT